MKYPSITERVEHRMKFKRHEQKRCIYCNTITLREIVCDKCKNKIDIESDIADYLFQNRELIVRSLKSVMADRNLEDDMSIPSLKEVKTFLSNLEDLEMQFVE